MNIKVLEKIDMTEEQVKRIEELGKVSWFANSSDEECKERIQDADVAVVDWIDPSSFILSMKSPSLLALMSTGFAWIQHRAEAKSKSILISNIPGYAAEAVAEHIIGLTLCVARQTMIGDRSIRAGKKEKGHIVGIELKNRKLGIIGLGRIGSRVAKVAQCIGMDVVTYNRHPKKIKGIVDLPLDELLSSCDVVCICCPLNDDSKGMLNKDRLSLMKKDAILVGTTWDVVVLDDLISALRNGYLFGAGFDVAIEGGEIALPAAFTELQSIVLTPHIGYNTAEAKVRQVDICIDNIEAFKNGKSLNVIN